MPYIAEEYGEAAHELLANLADCARITEPGDTNSDKARKFIRSIRDLNQTFEIDGRIPEIEEADIEEMVGYSFDEANPDYPVTIIFSREKFREMYKKVKYI